MRIVSRISAVLSWVLFVYSFFMQGLLILTLWMPPFFSGVFGGRRLENAVNRRALPFLIAGTVLFVAGFLLFCFLRRRRWIWYAAMAVGALVLAGVGLYLKVSYPETITSGGITTGYYSAFKLVSRHMVPIGVAALSLLTGVFGQIADDRRLRREAFEDVKGYKPRF